MKRVAIVIAAVAVAVALIIFISPKNQFVVGGALVNAGLRMQDHLHSYDFEHHEDITAEQVWTEFQRQNEMSAAVRQRFPRSTEHPVVAMLVCMDARIDTAELAGDTRRYYYVVRTAGSVLDEPEQEMLELAVANGVKLVVLTRHTDCAAEKAAKDPAKRAAFPHLVASVDNHDQRVAEFLERPLIKQRMAEGKLLVKQLVIDTTADHLVMSFAEAAPVPAAPAHAAAHAEVPPADAAEPTTAAEH